MAPRKKAAAETSKTKSKENTSVKNGGKVAKTPKPIAAKSSAKTKKLRESISAEPISVPSKQNKRVDAFISFEVCKSCHTYKRQATKLFKDLSALFPDKNFQMSINDLGPPRRGAFEVTISKKKGGKVDASLLWSGLKKGPPRREKFPEANVISDNLTKVLS